MSRADRRRSVGRRENESADIANASDRKARGGERRWSPPTIFLFQTHFLNKTPFDWFTKKQATVETATYGAESSAARTAIEQIRANKLMLMYLGVPVHNESYLFGDNKSVVDGTTRPHGQLHKRHHMLSYHYVREAIASGAVRFAHIPGDSNPADILSKHWGYQCVWKVLQPILFYQGDTMTLAEE